MKNTTVIVNGETELTDYMVSTPSQSAAILGRIHTTNTTALPHLERSIFPRTARIPGPCFSLFSKTGAFGGILGSLQVLLWLLLLRWLLLLLMYVRPRHHGEMHHALQLVRRLLLLLLLQHELMSCHGSRLLHGKGGHGIRVRLLGIGTGRSGSQLCQIDTRNALHPLHGRLHCRGCRLLEVGHSLHGSTWCHGGGGHWRSDRGGRFLEL